MIAGGVAGFSVAILLLGGTIAYEIAHRDAPYVRVSAAPARPSTAGTGGRVAPRRSDIDGSLSDILARPVFSPDRRPIGPGPRSIVGLSRLTGIVVMGSRKVAIFAAPSGGKPVIAEEGSRINAYEVKSISDSGVTVVGPEGTTVMTPLFDPTPPSVPVPKRPLPALAEPPRAQKR
jgi:hypothetical protein